MEIWLSKDKDRLRLPVLPSSIEAGSSNNNTTVDINARGEVMILGSENLRTMEISSFFPNHNYPFVEYNNFLEPWEFVSKILKWKASKEPIRILITDTILNMEVGIEDFTYGERDGSGDVYYSLSLKDYRRLAVKTKAVQGAYEKPKIKRPAPKPERKTYTVKRGDNLWNIAKQHTGNAMNWKKIYADNKKVIGKNANLIRPGQKLVL